MENTKLETILWTLCKVLCYQIKMTGGDSYYRLQLIKDLDDMMIKTEAVFKGDPQNARAKTTPN